MANNLGLTAEEINAFLADGSLLPSDQAWYEGAPEWTLPRCPVWLFGTTRFIAGCYGVVASGGSGKRKKLDRYCCRRGGFGGRRLCGDAFFGGKRNPKSQRHIGKQEKGVDGSVEMPRPRVGQ